MNSINCKGQLINLSEPKVMGILNITPDSFYDGGKFKSDLDYLIQVEKMLREGATFIDFGAYSSRPGAQHITEDEELQRLIPILTTVLDKFPEALISIDTFRSGVAEEAIAAGASIINDISAGNLDSNMFQTIANLQVPYIIMHMKGNPQNMVNQTNYQDPFKEIYFYFSQKLAALNALGVNDIIVDPGFGFSKTLEQNYELLSQLQLFSNLNTPLLIGVSRKSMLYKLLKTDAQNALNATTVANTIAIQKGANLLRVHDVKEAIETIKITQQLN